MSDITMCDAVGCALKQRCYRHTATPSTYRQSYFVKPPVSDDGESCEHVWDNEDRK